MSAWKCYSEGVGYLKGGSDWINKCVLKKQKKDRVGEIERRRKNHLELGKRWRFRALDQELNPSRLLTSTLHKVLEMLWFGCLKSNLSTNLYLKYHEIDIYLNFFLFPPTIYSFNAKKTFTSRRRTDFISIRRSRSATLFT